MAPEDVGRLLDRFDPERREFLRKVLIGSAYAIPFVASFSMDGLTISEAVAGSNVACSNISVANTDADLVISKSASPNPVVAGSNLTYTVVVQNCGPATANNVSVTDPVPVGTTFVSATQLSGPTFALATPSVGGTGNVTATIASLSPGFGASFEIIVFVTP